MTTVRPTLEIAARRATAERVEALLAASPGDQLADPRVVATLAGWLAAGARAHDVDAVRPATPGDLGLAAATARALDLHPAVDSSPVAGGRALVVAMDHVNDGVFQSAIVVVEASRSRVVGAVAVREKGGGSARLVAPKSRRLVALGTLTARLPMDRT